MLDHRTELEVAGIQLIHLPLWKVGYLYRPRNALRYFYTGKEKRMIMDGYGKGILAGELAIAHRDKVTVNAMVTGFSAAIFLILGTAWHPAFFIVCLFALVVSGISAYIGITKKAQQKEEELQKLSASLAVNNRDSVVVKVPEVAKEKPIAG